MLSISQLPQKLQQFDSCVICFHVRLEYYFEALIIMRNIYALLGFIALTLASPIAKQPRSTLVNPLDRPSTIESVHGVVSGGLIAEPPPAASISISTSSINATAHSPSSSTFPSQTSFSLPPQSQWGPGEISNVFFGGVATILGAVTVGLTYYLHRRRSWGQQSGSWCTMHLPIIKSLIVWSIDDSMELDTVRSFELSDGDGGGALPHEALPPAYTSVDSSAVSPSQQSQQGIGSPAGPRQEG